MQESNFDPLNPGERELELALMRLAATPAKDESAAIAYEAGRRAGRRSTVAWRVCSGVLAAGLAISLLPRDTGVAPSRGVRQVESLVSARRPMKPLEAGDGNGYLVVRDAVLAHGLDALPEEGTGGREGTGPPQRVMEIQKYSLHLPSLFGERS